MFTPNLEPSNPYPNILFPSFHQQISPIPPIYNFNHVFSSHLQDLNSQLEKLKNQNLDLTDENKNLKNQIEFLNKQVAEYCKLLTSNPPKPVLKLEEKTRYEVKLEPDTHSHHSKDFATTGATSESSPNYYKREDSSSISGDDDDDEAYEPDTVVKPMGREGRRKPRVSSSKAEKTKSPGSEETKENNRSIAKHVWIQYGRRIKDFALNQTEIDMVVKQKIKERRLETKSDYIILFQINSDDRDDEINFKQTYLDKAIDFMDQVKKNDNLFLNSNYRHELLQQREKVEKWIKQCKQMKRYK